VATNPPVFNIYLLGTFDHLGVEAVLAEIGLQGTRLEDTTTIVSPALILLGTGQSAPQGLADISIAFPPDASPAALRHLLHLAMENVRLNQEARQHEEHARHQHRQFEDLNQIGKALSAERDIDKLQELILTTMRKLTNADGASLWLKVIEGGQPKLRLAWSQNSSIDRNTYSDFKVLVDESTVVGYAVTTKTSQLYDDAYNPPPGKPQGGKGFDAQFGYRTKSMLTVPMRDYNNEVVGAVQLINAKRSFDTKLTVGSVSDEVVSFRQEDLEMVESVASQAAIALDNKKLLKEIEDLFDKFVTASVYAIEQRDPTTEGHSRRVTDLTLQLASEVTMIEAGKFRDIVFSDDQLKELRYACLLHDFGKIGVREDILNKEKKLFPFQLDMIKWRFDSRERLAENKYLRSELDQKRLEAELDQFRMWYDAITKANEPTVLPEDKASILSDLKGHAFADMSGQEHFLVAPEEFHFLSIKKGTLTSEEFKEIESHVTKSHDFLQKIPWTSEMKDIPEIAWGHHEKLDGSGYPRGLRGDEIRIQTRMMTISDIYDALTARDRLYKPAVPALRALDILKNEFKGKVDADLLDVFIEKRVYDVTAPE
jgi:HD-GYP domain-containing protein (c-di-GMP phosphodiesterase class II)